MLHLVSGINFQVLSVNLISVPLSLSDLPVHAKLPVSSPFSPSVTPSLFHFLLKTYLFHKSFPPWTPFLSAGRTPRLYNWTVSSEHLGFCLSFVHYYFCLVPCGRLSPLCQLFGARKYASCLKKRPTFGLL